MFIKDLEIAQDLSHEERAAVRGGNTSQIGLNVGGPVLVGASGYSFASPVTVVTGPQINENTSTTTNVDVASILNSAYAGIGQL
jgi:Flp pilus assembly protein TadG